jgi:hypothetical protein
MEYELFLCSATLAAAAGRDDVAVGSEQLIVSRISPK